MFKSILPIGIAFIVGWTVHSLYADYSQEMPVNITAKVDCSDFEISSTPEIIEKVVIKEVIKLVPQTKVVYRIKNPEAESNNSEKDQFLLYLEKKEFYEAMGYYDEADEEKHPSYQMALVSYFNKEGNKNFLKTVEEMQYFIEMESESKVIIFQLSRLFEKKELYQEALNLIIDFSYIVSYNEKSAIHTKIKSISTSYISKLTSANNFKDLIDFLLTYVNIGILSEFYSFELAKAYLKLKKYIDSMEILEVLKSNEIYKERAVELLAFIEERIEELEEYPIQIPLIKSGSHFLVKAYAENVPVLLLVDTGASITSVNHHKISHFKVATKNALFHTAGGDIFETIFQAEQFSIGSVLLENFKITGDRFSGSRQDGLLGMNFLGRYKFKIDQKEAILFLGKKH